MVVSPMSGRAEETSGRREEATGKRGGIQSVAGEEARAASGGEEDPPSSGDGEDELSSMATVKTWLWILMESQFSIHYTHFDGSLKG